MASHSITCPRAAAILLRNTKHHLRHSSLTPAKTKIRSRVIRVSNGGGDSYLDMWKKAVDREKEEIEFRKLVENSQTIIESGGGGYEDDDVERKTNEFQKILEVSKEERDRIQRIQVVDRAAAAIAAANAILEERKQNEKSRTQSHVVKDEGGRDKGTLFQFQSGTLINVTPGPDFWSWTPPLKNDTNPEVRKSSPHPAAISNPVVEKERSMDFLPIPFETKLSEKIPNPSLPPLQSSMEVEKLQTFQEEHKLGVQFSEHAAEAARVLDKVGDVLAFGEYEDGSRWWKETGVERRADGVVCKWTLIRGVSADEAVEWEDKFWEAADGYDFKELGSEKSGRDAMGNVWREYWKETMWQERGLMHIEKTADKWGKNGKGDEWHEKWWEQYNAADQAEKWAHKWSSIDPNTHLEAGHAHVWHEKWGEKYDGRGGSVKYTDKWAERSKGDGWEKWGDKWDENFDLNGNGVKQGEKWWEGKDGDRWNRTWGEGHNGSGWVHKYGKSSCGEHWDTHEEQETWYEKYPHYGFMHCYDNSVQLREVQKPPETS